MISNSVHSYASFSLKGTLNVAIMTKLKHFLKNTLSALIWSKNILGIVQILKWEKICAKKKSIRQRKWKKQKVSDYNREELYKSRNLKKLHDTKVYYQNSLTIFSSMLITYIIITPGMLAAKQNLHKFWVKLYKYWQTNDLIYGHWSLARTAIQV